MSFGGQVISYISVVYLLVGDVVRIELLPDWTKPALIAIVEIKNELSKFIIRKHILNERFTI